MITTIIHTYIVHNNTNMNTNMNYNNNRNTLGTDLRPYHINITLKYYTKMSKMKRI